MTSYFFLFNLAAILCISFAHPASNDLKTKFAEDNEISGSKFGAKGVSAEFGGYKVAAGLGGGDAGGGLFAKAEAPSASAGAGLFGGAGGGAGGAGATAGFEGFDGNRQPVPNGGGFFDRIFNIPISVLHSVNSYVKSKDSGHHASAAAGPGSTYATETRFAANDEDGSVSGASATASASGAGASAGAGGATVGSKVRGKPDYDKIFNIPISALRSVNEMLNG